MQVFRCVNCFSFFKVIALSDGLSYSLIVLLAVVDMAPLVMSARGALTWVSWTIPMKVPMALSKMMITRKESQIIPTAVRAATRKMARHGSGNKRSLAAKEGRRRSARQRRSIKIILQLSYLWNLTSPRMLMQEPKWGRWSALFLRSFHLIQTGFVPVVSWCKLYTLFLKWPFTASLVLLLCETFLCVEPVIYETLTKLKLYFVWTC